LEALGALAAMGVRRHHLDRDAVRKEHIPSGEIPLGDIQKNIRVGRISVDPPSIAAGAYSAFTVTFSGLAATDEVILMPPSDLEDGLILIGAHVTAADTITIKLHNKTGAAIDGAARDWAYIAFSP